MDEHYTDDAAATPENPEDAVEIYSRRAVLGFSIFFSTIFGGVLLMINLWQVGYKKAAWTVLGFSVLYTLIASIMVNIMKNPNSFMAIGFNLMGGLILVNYFFPKYFPDDDYYPKPIWNALALSIIITLGIALVMYYSGNLPEWNKALSKK